MIRMYIIWRAKKLCFILIFKELNIYLIPFIEPASTPTKPAISTSSTHVWNTWLSSHICASSSSPSSTLYSRMSQREHYPGIEEGDNSCSIIPNFLLEEFLTPSKTPLESRPRGETGDPHPPTLEGFPSPSTLHFQKYEPSRVLKNPPLVFKNPPMVSKTLRGTEKPSTLQNNMKSTLIQFLTDVLIRP